METIVKSKNGNYFLRAMPGYKQFKPYTKDEMIYYSISDSESLTNNSSDVSILYNTDEDLMEKNVVNDMNKDMEEDMEEKDMEEQSLGKISFFGILFNIAIKISSRNYYMYERTFQINLPTSSESSQN